jgi:hypothetical protein
VRNRSSITTTTVGRLGLPQPTQQRRAVELRANALFPTPNSVGRTFRSGAAGRGGARSRNASLKNRALERAPGHESPRMRLWDVTRRTRAPKGPSDVDPMLRL